MLLLNENNYYSRINYFNCDQQSDICIQLQQTTAASDKQND